MIAELPGVGPQVTMQDVPKCVDVVSRVQQRQLGNKPTEKGTIMDIFPCTYDVGIVTAF